MAQWPSLKDATIVGPYDVLQNSHVL